jgi:hypothetical protein
MRIIIDEQMARWAKESNSFNDYKEGSTTAEYLAECEEVEAKINTIDPKYQDQIIKLVDRFTTKLGNWINAYNKNQASYPSVMIAGPAKYNYRKHKAKMSRENTLWKEYDEIKALKEKIINFTPKLDKGDEVTRLTKEIENKKAELQNMKDCANYYRKNQTLEGFIFVNEGLKSNAEFRVNQMNSVPFDSYNYSLQRDKIQRLENNLAKLTTPKEESKETEVKEGIKIVENTELNRLQILFNGIPSVEIRNLLKSKGFRWSPSNMAWQRQLTQNARYDAKQILQSI